MSVVLDSSSSISGSDKTSFTWSHTVRPGNNRALVISAQCPNSVDCLAAATVTYNGVSLGAPVASKSIRPYTYVWMMCDPPVGTGDIVITPSASAYVDAYASSWTGVDSSGVVLPLTQYSNGYSISPVSVAIDLPAGGVAIDHFAILTTDGTFAPEVEQTVIAAQQTDGVSRSGASYKTDATAMTWTFTAIQPVTVLVAIGLKPAQGGDEPPPDTPPDAPASGSLQTDVLTNNTGSVLSGATVRWTWYQGAIGAAPTAMAHGEAITDGAGRFTATGLPSGNGFLLMSDSSGETVAYQPGSI